MLTVAVDATPLLGQPTGVGVAVGGLLGALAGAGLDLVGYGLTGTGWRQLAGVLPPGVRPAGPRPMPAAVLQRLWAHVDGPALQWWTGPLDVVHGTNFVVPPARRAARLVTVHDLTPVRFPELCPPAARRYPELIRAALRAGAAIHTPSRFVADEVTSHFAVDPGRVHVVPWGLAPRPGGVPPHGGPLVGRPADGRPADARPADARPADARPAFTGPPYLLGLGTVEPRKDFPLLVRAFDVVAATHGELELRIVGPEGSAEQALGAAVAASPHAARIRRIGWVADPTALIAGAAAFAYPSRYEGFGFPPLEAMALGVPVVATAAGAVPEVLGGAADLTAVGDVDGLASALARVLDDDTHRRRLIAAGTERVNAFTWEATGGRMAALYRELAGA